MRCHEKSIFPNHLKEAFDEIESINSIWFNFDIRKRISEQNENVTIFFEMKAGVNLYDSELTDIYKVVSVYVNDIYMDKNKLYSKVITENYKINIAAKSEKKKVCYSPLSLSPQLQAEYNRNMEFECN